MKLVRALLLSAFLLNLYGCNTPPPTFEIGPQAQIEIPNVGEVEVAVTIDTNGDVVLSGSVSQTLKQIGPVGVGWTAGFEKVLYESRQETNTPSLFILWEDDSGEIWREQYDIGQPFHVTFNDDQRVRDLKSDGRNVLVAVEPTGSVPGYDELELDVQSLVERWDRAHYNADRYWDTSDLSSVLSGEALYEQEEAVQWLTSNNCYWEIYELDAPEITYFEAIGSSSAVVDVRKNWDMDLYCNGSKNDDDDGYFTVRYHMDRVNGDWYITEKRVTERQ